MGSAGQAIRMPAHRAGPDPWIAKLLALVAMMGIASAIWNSHVGIAFRSARGPATSAAAFGLLAIIYATIRPAPRIAEAAGFVVLWIGFTEFGARLSYLAATLGYPIQDARLAAMDAAIGFDWRVWVGWLQAHPRAEAVLSLSYGSFLPQLAASVLIFAFCGAARRNAELLTVAAISIAVCIAVSAVLPASGAYHPGFTPPTGENIDLMALRSGVRSFATFNGLISFPSFHAVMAIAFAYAHRGLRWSFPPFLALNALMLVATVHDGGHYLVDLAGGATVAVVSIALARGMFRSSGPRLPGTPPAAWAAGGVPGPFPKGVGRRLGTIVELRGRASTPPPPPPAT